ncbi:MAG: SAM-dependent chlorinase/fluorinase [Phycisphaeraceae bacterium]
MCAHSLKPQDSSLKPVITLTTDFGTQDTYVAQMKGVILGIALDAQIIDLSHSVPPQDVVAGALMLEATLDYFPPGSVHVGVVDPGVGTTRAGLAIQTRNHLYVGPDNGLFTAVIDRNELVAAVKLTNRAYHLHPTSATFHGRDVFAPAAAHLAKGVPLDQLGEATTDLVRLDLPHPVRVGDMLEAHVIRIDRFGNLITDLTASALRDWECQQTTEGVTVMVGDATICNLARTFADVPDGDPVAYFGSTGRLEVAVRNGNAAERFSVGPGATVLLRREL